MPDQPQSEVGERSQSNAERQLESARRDPRLDHAKTAVVADWWAALEAAELTRMTAMLGATALKQTLSGMGSGRDVAWERGQLGAAQVENDFVEVNAQALVALMSALDALVEGLAPRAREMVVRAINAEAVRRATEKLSEEAKAKVKPEQLEAIEQAANDVILDQLGTIPRAGGAGAWRWEEVLRNAGLAAPDDRPIPDDLDESLAELVSIRHVLVHRAGRVDQKALDTAPSLKRSYSDGDLVRIKGGDYRRYAAAIRTYGGEVVYRFSIPLGAAPPLDLEDWRGNYIAGY